MVRASIFAVGIILAAAPAAAADQVDLLKAGQLQCYGPNTVKHTCAALSGYTFSGNTIMNRAEVLVSIDPVGTMTTNSSVTIRNGAICGTPSKKDIDESIITSEGVKLGEDQAAHVKAQIWATVAPNAGKELCTIYEPIAEHYTTKYTLDGKPDDTPPTTVILVGPKGGYRVAP